MQSYIQTILSYFSFQTLFLFIFFNCQSNKNFLKMQIISLDTNLFSSTWNLTYKKIQIIIIYYIMIRSISPINRSRKISMLSEQRTKNPQLKTETTHLCSRTTDYDLYYEPKLNRKFQQYTFKLQNHQINSFIETNNWRVKTSIPIVRTYYLKLIDESNSYKSYHIQNQHCPYRLQDFHNIPLNQILYLMKQSIIGFQRLYQKFGPFRPTSRMVAINQNNKCKVWFDEYFGANEPRPAELSIETFLRRIIQIFYEKVEQSTLSIQFFNKCKGEKNLVKILRLIDSFVLQKRIPVPFKFDEKNCLKHKNGSGEYHINTEVRNLTPQKNYNSGLLTEKISLDSRKNIKHWAVESTYVQTKRQLEKLKLTTITPKRTINYWDLQSPKTPTKSEDNVKRPLKKVSIDYLIDSKELKQSFSRCLVGEGELKKSTYEKDMNIMLLPRTNTNPQQKHHLIKKSTRDSDEEPYRQVNPIFAKNGWQKKFQNLLSNSNCNLKQSIVHGKDIRSDLLNTRLLKIQSLGGNIVDSILPEDFK